MTPGPFDPGDMPRIPEIETATLEAIRIAASAELSPQIAHDVELRVVEDMMTQRLVFGIQTVLYGLKEGHTTQRVPYSHRVTASKEAAVKFTAPITFAALTLLAAVVVGVAGMPLVGGVVAVIAAVQYVVGRTPRYETVTVDFDERVHGEVEITAESWTVFPENKMVFPKDLGRPQQIVRYSSPENLYRDE